MNYLYILLDLGSLSIPFLFSFHPKLRFYRYWKALAIALIISMTIYIPWDIIFTQNGYWGFNDHYLLGQHILGLPLEEWLFFICIPYACVFTHYALRHYFPNTRLSKKLTQKFCYALIIVFLLISLIFYNKWYTVINFGYAVILLAVVMNTNIKLLQSYFCTFLVMLIPFFIVNGILTGSGIDNEVVWYDNAQNLNLRMLTIPVEDAIYAFTLILTNLALVDFIQSKSLKKQFV